MKTLYVVYRDETLIGLVSNEEAGWEVVALDELDRKNEKSGSILPITMWKKYIQT